LKAGSFVVVVVVVFGLAKHGMNGTRIAYWYAEDKEQPKTSK
jgi:hypothetical protein